MDNKEIDIIGRLSALLPLLEEAKETHKQWSECDQRYRDENPDIGDAQFHADCVAEYQERIDAIKQAISTITVDREFISDWNVFFPDTGPRELHAELKQLKEQGTFEDGLQEKIEKAHMAGQLYAGADISYSAARAHWLAIIKALEDDNEQ